MRSLMMLSGEADMRATQVQMATLLDKWVWNEVMPMNATGLPSSMVFVQAKPMSLTFLFFKCISRVHANAILDMQVDVDLLCGFIGHIDLRMPREPTRECLLIAVECNIGRPVYLVREIKRDGMHCHKGEYSVFIDPFASIRRA